jgi:hypothetical protein
MIKNTARFVKEFIDVSPKFDWFFVIKKYSGKNGPIVIKEVRGTKKGGDYTKEYIPLTAYAEYISGRFFDKNRFDLAASEICMSPECAIQIVDSCDDWPDRLHGYSPKIYEVKLREDILKACSINNPARKI